VANAGDFIAPGGPLGGWPGAGGSLGAGGNLDPPGGAEGGPDGGPEGGLEGGPEGGPVGGPLGGPEGRLEGGPEGGPLGGPFGGPPPGGPEGGPLGTPLGAAAVVGAEESAAPVDSILNSNEAAFSRALTFVGALLGAVVSTTTAEVLDFAFTSFTRFKSFLA